MFEQKSTTDDAAVYAPGASIDDGAFALRVRDDSMVDTAGSLSFPIDCIIVVDPSVTAAPGDHIVVRLKGAKEATFRKLDFDGESHFLMPLNPRYPIAPMPEDARIVGVVVQMSIAVVPGIKRVEVAHG
jgi:SOS-response transcriptional repressor LexA